MNLKDAKILITGGNSGIGYETAKLLQSKGANVFICGRNESTLQKTIQELGVKGIKADVSNPEDVERLVQTAIEQLGGLDAVVNNAGFGSFASLIDTKLEDFTTVWETNVKGAFLVGQACAKHFITQKAGNIINIASTAALRGFAGGSAYCSSKFALTALTECWRAELRQYNIRVMQVNPSEVITSFMSNANLGENKDIEKKLKPSEIAHTIAAMLEMNNVGFITDATVFATNP